jgi:Rrf2 family protein
MSGPAPTLGPSPSHKPVHITARTDYALRAVLALAAADPATVTASALAAREGMPLSFLKTILGELRGADLIATQRGPERGYRLTRPATDISVGEVIRVVDGSLTDIRGEPAADASYEGTAIHLRHVWLAADTAVQNIVDQVTLADVVTGNLPPHVRDLTG